MTTGKDVPEKEIEKQVCLYAKGLGWWVPKLTLFSGGGFPDRTCIGFGSLFFIEFKRKGKKESPRQQYVIRKIRGCGFRVYVIDSVEEGKRLLDEITIRTETVSGDTDTEDY